MHFTPAVLALLTALTSVSAAPSTHQRGPNNSTISFFTNSTGGCIGTPQKLPIDLDAKNCTLLPAGIFAVQPEFGTFDQDLVFYRNSKCAGNGTHAHPPKPNAADSARIGKGDCLVADHDRKGSPPTTVGYEEKVGWAAYKAEPRRSN
ncbi:MAG: hypothetical protein Q9165_004261 [Trypethelium subeluteriae]